jgi:Protein of unknown function (DUF3592)
MAPVSPPPRRPIEGLGVTVAMLGLATITVFLGYREIYPLVLLRARGVETTATVVGHEIRNRDAVTVVRFTDRLGHAQVAAIPGRVGDESQTGQPLRILYDPRDPANADLTNPLRWEIGRAFFVIWVVLWLNGFFTWKRRRRRPAASDE